MYRLPWRIGTSPTLSVSLTNGCGLECCGNRCDPRPLGVIKTELEATNGWPRADSIALVGGEPSLHPNLDEIVKSAARNGKKVVLCTNGYDLGVERLTELRNAGLWGVNLRILRGQARPGWRDRHEAQLEGLRTHYAELVSRVGGLLCGFELEVAEGNFRQLSDVLAWAERNLDRVQRIVLRLVDVESKDNPGVRPGDMAENWATSGWFGSRDPNVPSGSMAWRVGRRGNDILAASPRLLEMLCEAYEHTHHRHFAFINPQSLHAQLSLWLGVLTDRSLRPLAKECLSSLRSPSRFVSPRLASQFLITLDPDKKASQSPPCPGAGWDSLSAPIGTVLLNSGSST